MTANGTAYRLHTLVPLTAATGSGLWATPSICGNYNRKGASPTSGDGLATQVRQWPTPRAAYAMGSSGGKDRRSDLRDTARQFPTPTARDWKDVGQNTDCQKLAKKSRLSGVVMTYMTPTAQVGTKGGGRHRGRADTIGSQVAELEGMNQTTTGQLNPTWVEWLMGYPLGWTDLKG